MSLYGSGHIALISRYNGDAEAVWELGSGSFVGDIGKRRFILRITIRKKMRDGK